MINIYTLSSTFYIFCMTTAIILFIASSLLYYFLMPQQEFRHLGRKCLEGSNLVVLLAIATILHEVFEDGASGILYIKAMDVWRYGIILISLISTLYMMYDRHAGGQYLLMASFLLLPELDTWLPWSLLLALSCIALRLIRVFPVAYRQYREQLTARSIQSAVDFLEEGVLLSLEKGEPVLVNYVMYDVMEKLLGTVIRNANIFWHILANWNNTERLTMERQGRDFLFRRNDGAAWLLQRRYIRFRNQLGWQITALDVTNLDRVNRELDQKNQLLEQRNEKMKYLLNHLVDIQTRRTTEEMRYKIHDLMGQRITILQQLLNNKNTTDYAIILPLVENVLADMRRETVDNPADRLNVLVHTYGSLGIGVTVTGSLPANQEMAAGLVGIIREALTNAILHGKASQVSIDLHPEGKHILTVSDNGIGCHGSIRPGNGLQGIERRVRKMGATLHLTGTPHFVLSVEREDDYDSRTHH